jgi:hypothetical protein
VIVFSVFAMVPLYRLNGKGILDKLPPVDHGQPTHYYPRRHVFVFKVPLPTDWDKEKRLIWTVTAQGRTGLGLSSVMVKPRQITISW